MDNNIVKVQLASSVSLGMKIESKHKNTISQNDQAFDQLLNIVSENKVWNKNSNGELTFPITYDQNIKIWGNDTVSEHDKLALPNVAGLYQPYVEEASQRYHIPASIINAVIKAESSFNPNATSKAGAKGLMQLMDGTARGLGVTNSYDPGQNINGGSKYLSMLLNKYDGELKVALAAYNAGPTRVDRSGIKNNVDFDQMKSTLPKETQNYVDKIMSYL